MKEKFSDILEDNPVIAAVKNFEELEKCLLSETRIVFILFGDICNIADIVKKVKASGKIVIAHIDLINGLTPKETAINFIKQQTEADGIITTKQNIAKYAYGLGLYTVLRYFIMDSMSLLNAEKQIGGVYADAIEILPGIMPKIIKRINDISKTPVIAGGLICNREDVMTALKSGAVAISSTNEQVWFL